MISTIKQGIAGAASFETLVAAIVSGGIAYMFWKFKRIESKVDKSVTMEEVEKRIDEKMEFQKELLKENVDKTKEIDKKLDYIIMNLNKSKYS